MMRGKSYQNVAYNVIAECLGCYRQIGMDCLPVAKESIEVDRVYLSEKDGDFDVWLEVRFSIVAQLGMCKLVLDFLPRHTVLR